MVAALCRTRGCVAAERCRSAGPLREAVAAVPPARGGAAVSAAYPGVVAPTVPPARSVPPPALPSAGACGRCGAVRGGDASAGVTSGWVVAWGSEAGWVLAAVALSGGLLGLGCAGSSEGNRGRRKRSRH